VLVCEFAESQTFVQLPHQNQPASEVTRDPSKSTFKEALKES